MVLRISSIALSICLLSGCASIVNGTHQNIMVSTAYDKNGIKTRCTLTNDEGAWNGMTDSNISIRRDGNNMLVQCENDKQTGISYVEPKFNNEYLVLDLLFLGVVTSMYDIYNDSIYQYPSLVSVDMKEKYPGYNYDQSIIEHKGKLHSIQEYINNVCRQKEYDEDYIGCINERNDELISASLFPDLIIKMLNSRKEFEQQLLNKKITRKELRDYADKLSIGYFNQFKERVENDIKSGVYTGKI